MWNKESVMHMLEAIPSDDKQAIQSAIDYDKYVNSEILNCDLCGGYAPFCENCALHSPTICAKSYAEYVRRYRGDRIPSLKRYSIRDEKNIQKVIDVDKYVKSECSNCDLCGSYAHFCCNCVLHSSTPCADAYLAYVKPSMVRLCTIRCVRKLYMP